MEGDTFEPRTVNMRLIVLERAFVFVLAVTASLDGFTQNPIVLPDTITHKAWLGLTEDQQMIYLEKWDDGINAYVEQLEQQLELEINKISQQEALQKSAFLRQKSAALDSLENAFLLQFEALSGQEEQSFYKEKKYQARDALQADYDQAKDRFQAAWAGKEQIMLDKLHQLSASNTQLFDEMLNKNLAWLESYRNRLISLQNTHN
ncbi:MAG: hypothetical protein KDC59_14770 [Saprospiraceae bacterium]|nr:hypothetical protein [Saprospiraceae bacterium]HPG08995.1 hypothetical protein [Saprospiraceae bacterium]HQU54015.1 hypothetical protein [Saprospiraceae bacterium]